MTWEYWNWDNNAIQTVINGMGLLAGLVTLTFLYHEYQSGKENLAQVKEQIGQVREQLWMSAFTQCEESFGGIQQMLINDPDLLDDYIRINELSDLSTSKKGEERSSKTADEQARIDNKLFVFYETYYGHMARVFALTHRDAIAGKEVHDYWMIYDNFLAVLCRSSHFKRVHATCKKHQSFENAFIRQVDQKLGLSSVAPAAGS